MLKINRNATIDRAIILLSKAKADPRDPKTANRRLIVALKGRDLNASQKKLILEFVNDLEGE